MTVCICPDAGMNGHVMNCPMRKSAEPAKRIFDDPDHPQYGPVRRMWVVLAQLDMLEAAERYSASPETIVPWDQYIAINLKAYPNVSESQFQRELIASLFEGWL